VFIELLILSIIAILYYKLTIIYVATVTLWWSTEVRLRNGIFIKDGAVQMKFLSDILFGVIIKAEQDNICCS
jgi:hypothetical protein